MQRTTQSKRRKSSVNAQPHNRIITDGSTKSQRPSRSPDLSKVDGTPFSDPESPVEKHKAPERGAGIPASNPTRKNELLISEGQGLPRPRSNLGRLPKRPLGTESQSCFWRNRRLRTKSESRPRHRASPMGQTDLPTQMSQTSSAVTSTAKSAAYRGATTSAKTAPTAKPCGKRLPPSRHNSCP